MIEIDSACRQVDAAERTAAGQNDLTQLQVTLKKDLLKALDESLRASRGLEDAVVTTVRRLYEEGIAIAERIATLPSVRDPLRSSVVEGVYGIKKEIENMCEYAFIDHARKLLAQSDFHPLDTATWCEAMGWKRLDVIAPGEEGQKKALQSMSAMHRVATFRIAPGPPHHDYRKDSMWILYKPL